MIQYKIHANVNFLWIALEDLCSFNHGRKQKKKRYEVKEWSFFGMPQRAKHIRSFNKLSFKPCQIMSLKDSPCLRLLKWDMYCWVKRNVTNNIYPMKRLKVIKPVCATFQCEEHVQYKWNIQNLHSFAITTAT